MQRTGTQKFLFALLSVILVLTLSGIICFIAFIIYATGSENLKIDEFFELARAQERTTRLYYKETDENGIEALKELENEALYAQQNREWVAYSDIPKDLINAFVAIEDHRFFEHNGVDLKRTAGAIVGFITGKSSYGGSTITQQLVKNITGQSDYSVSRKIKEMIKAAKIDSTLTKEEILELYLNTIYLSHASYGIGTAAETYFGKEANELTLVECAALACIPQSPTKWDPIINPENNKKRRETVLFRMHELGFISEKEYADALESELIISNDRTHNTELGQIHSWYTESVISEAITLLVENGVASSEQTAKKLLYTGGLHITTAINPKMQEAVEKYYQKESNFYHEGLLIHPECSMVIINPRNGNILALAGGTGKKSGNRVLNYATSTTRSPGSSIKPLSVYAPAIDKGVITYGTVVDDTPYRFVSNGYGGMRGWPQNYPQGYRGLTTIRDAVNRSVNTVAVKVLDKVGKDYSFSLLHDGMEMKNLLSSANKNGNLYTDVAESPLALGQLTRGVTVAEITAGYTALANGGVFNKAKTVLKIYDASGKLLIDNTGGEKQLFSEQSATIMTKLLQGVTASGTASAMTLKKSFDCAGKTGTTTSDCDRWFIGYTPDLLAGVWFGYPTPKSLDGYPTSPSPALKTFDNVMKIINSAEYLGHEPSRHFADADGIIAAKYCRDSGKLVSSACLCDPRGSRVETGYFTAETLPREYCNTHTLVLYDTVNKGVASPECKRENCRYVGLLRVNRRFDWPVVIFDSEFTTQTLQNGVPPCLDSSKPFFYYNHGAPLAGRSASAIPFNRYCSGCKLEAVLPEEDYEDVAPPSSEQSNGKNEELTDK